MKVIHFIASLDKSAGGTTAYMQLVAQELKTQIEIVIATGISPNPLKIHGVKVKYFNTHLSRWFSIQKEFYDFLIAGNPDLVHINGIWNPENWLFQKVAQKLGIKVILSPHGMLEPYILNRNPLKKKLALALYQDRAIKNAEYFHATAISEAKNIEKLGYLQQISVIPNGIKIANFPINESEKADNPKKILFLSRIHPKKGIEFLIEAWSQLDSKFRKDWLVEIIGNGEESYIESLKEKINMSDLQNQIKIKAPVFGLDKIKIFREASLFVLPTYSENFGIVVAEALASYTPVITTDGTPWEELNSRNSGWWIEIGTEPLKVALIEALNASESELKIKGQNGRYLIEEKFSIEAVGKQMINLYNSLI